MDQNGTDGAVSLGPRCRVCCQAGPRHWWWGLHWLVLLPKLLDAGYHVRLLDLLFYSTEPLQGVLSHPGLEVIQADFRQVDRVVEAMQDVDAVIHLGAIVGDPACALDEELTIEVNLMATRMIAEVARGAGSIVSSLRVRAQSMVRAMSYWTSILP